MSDAVASSSGRSFVDPLSNLVFLSSLNVGRHIRQIQDKDLPPESLAAFMHEATHHWCAYSPVGLAQILLFFRARRAAVKHATRDGVSANQADALELYERRRDAEWTVLDAVARYQFAQGLMEPLAEGLALFAEHDACVGSAETISAPAVLASTLYAQGLAVRSSPPFSKFPLVLAGSRLTRNHIRRKADLLIQPLSCANGGYLPGYLALKTAWQANLLHGKCAAFVDTDFFLQFARSHFYDDWKLVAALLDDTRSDAGALDPIARIFQERLNTLAVAPDRVLEAERFERTSKSARPRMKLRTEIAHIDVMYDSIRENSEEDEFGKERLQTVFRELFESWPSDPVEQALTRLDLEMLRLSQTLTLANGEVQGRRQGARLSFSGTDMEPFNGPAPTKMPDGWQGPVQLDAIASLMPPGLFLIIATKDGVLEAHSLGNTADGAWLEQPMATMTLRSQFANQTRELLDAVLKDESFQLVQDHVREELARMVPQIYLPRALAGVPDASMPKIQALMKEDGFLPLLQRDLGSVLDCAAISLATPLRIAPNSVHSWRDGDMLSAARKLNEILEPTLGFPPFMEHKGVILASFI